MHYTLTPPRLLRPLLLHFGSRTFSQVRTLLRRHVIFQYKITKIFVCSEYVFLEQWDIYITAGRCRWVVTGVCAAICWCIRHPPPFPWCSQLAQTINFGISFANRRTVCSRRAPKTTLCLFKPDAGLTHNNHHFLYALTTVKRNHVPGGGEESVIFINITSCCFVGRNLILILCSI